MRGIAARAVTQAMATKKTRPAKRRPARPPRDKLDLTPQERKLMVLADAAERGGRPQLAKAFSDALGEAIERRFAGKRARRFRLPPSFTTKGLGNLRDSRRG